MSGNLQGKIQKNYQGQIEIKDTVTYDGITYKVTAIGEDAFSDTYITSIVIPEGVTSIGKSAFNLCNKLTSITLPSTLNSIGDYCFYQCEALGEITFPENLKFIGQDAFKKCAFQKLYIPGSVETIKPWAFRYCFDLESVAFGEGTKEISDSLFYYCKKLNSVTIPEGVKSIGKHVFEKCTALKTITFPKSLTTIKKEAFLNSGITSLNIDNALTDLQDSAFIGCDSLETVTITAPIKEIGDHLFHKCPKLQSVTFPETVEKIGKEAFCGSCIKEIKLPSGLQSIGIWGFAYTDIESVELPEGMTSFGGLGVFEQCYSLKSVKLPTTLTMIDSNSFYGCSSLETIVIPENVTRIGEYAFAFCENLKEITLPEGLMTIYSDAFENCTSLEHIIIPSTVTYIGGENFYGCSNLKSFTCLAKTPPTLDPFIFAVYHLTFDGMPEDKVLHVLPGCKAKYEEAEQWKDFTIVEDANEIVTGIRNVNTTSSPANNIYSITGVKQSAPRKGINIINGHKYLIK